MRTQDTICLGEVYSKIRILEEAKFRDIAAAAALGLSNLAGAQPGITSDDYADRANPHSASDNLLSQPQTKEPEETDWHKAKVAYDKAVSERKADEETLKKIALNTDIAKRYAGHLVLMGHDVPNIIRKAAAGAVEEIEKAKRNPI
jgi:hypothetical protein